MDIRKSVKIALIQRGVNDAWLADKINISRSGLSLALSRGSLSSKRLLDIANALGLRVSELIALGENN